MHGIYDYLFVTHLPAFYKVNLYNEIAKHSRVFVIFIAKSSDIRTQDFTGDNFAFDYRILNTVAFEKRNIISSIFALISILRKLKFNKLIVGGWDLLEFWMLILFSPKCKNCLALESTIYESHVKGFRGRVKKIFLSRIDEVFSCGQPHVALLYALGFMGKIKKTLGVGIFNYQAKEAASKNFKGNFLYVGRLAKEKNIFLLLEAFKKLPQFTLTLIGQGPLQKKLQALNIANVKFLNHVPNEKLAKEYQAHDILILPSLREPWGLVVEEALFYGLPVIASSRVGCALDLITHYQAGTVFNPNSAASLQQAIEWTIENYSTLLEKVNAINFKARDDFQVLQYLQARL